VIKRELNEFQKKMLEGSAAHYVQNAKRYLSQLEEIEL
jgi:carbonic anhydrase/acetyltransferase-like protein (isoleucine patch superfamily)